MWRDIALFRRLVALHIDETNKGRRILSNDINNNVTAFCEFLRVTLNYYYYFYHY